MAELFRKNAGIVVFNTDKKVLICQRSDTANSWQFPQGGIEQGETVQEAATRELAEETSITSATWIKSLDFPARYHFPPEILAKMQKRGFLNAGQDMYWSLFYFDGKDSEINLQTAEPEFKAYRWTTLQEAYDLIVEFKKEAYAIAVKEFTHIIENY